MEKILRIIEIIGLIVLLLIITAISGMKIEVHSQPVFVSLIALSVMVIISIFLSIGRILRLTRGIKNLIISGFVLLLSGGLVMIFIPEFFNIMKNIPYSYWHKVSVYSLPAVCIEGGLFNLFQAHVLSSRKTTKRENVFLFSGFLVYAITAVSINFFALSEVVSIKEQLMFSKNILLMTIIISFVVYLKNIRKP